MKIKILNDLINDLPSYESSGSAGIDLRACIKDNLVIQPNKVELIPTGLAVFISDSNLAGLILPRSGLGHKKGLVLGNLVGLIDSDYQGEIMISAWNRSDKNISINKLDRIAQLVIIPIKKVKFELVKSFEKSDRGSKGFGSTGIK
tara:strand:+ start:67 stop:504 length:438 start_codon:yes stop_codon:yes gene_type:complete